MGLYLLLRPGERVAGKVINEDHKCIALGAVEAAGPD